MKFGLSISKFGAAAPLLRNLKSEYLWKERSCGAKTSMVNRYYNVCYAESIVFMFHEVLRFIITKNIFLHWRQVAPPRRHLAPFGATQCLEGPLKSRPRSKRKFFFWWTLWVLYQLECVLSIFHFNKTFWRFPRRTSIETCSQ